MRISLFGKIIGLIVLTAVMVGGVVYETGKGKGLFLFQPRTEDVKKQKGFYA